MAWMLNQQTSQGPRHSKCSGILSNIPYQDYCQELRHCKVLEAQRNKVVGVEEARTFDCTSGARTMSVKSYQLPALDTNFLPVIGARSEPITATCYTRTSLTRDSQE